MCNLQDLPAELWFSISSYLRQRSVLTVSLTSKRMHKLATPGLYRQVYYWASSGKCGSGILCCYGIDILCSCEAEILRGTRLEYQTEKSITSSCNSNLSRIFKPNAFSKSLTRSPWLRSLVHSVDLKWHDSDHDERLYRLLEALASSPLQHIYLYPSHPGFLIPPSIPVTSLGTEWPGKIDSDRLDRVYELSLLPSLRHMCLKNWEYAGGTQLLRLDISSASLQQALNITHLSFRDGNVPAQILQAIVSWPRALRSFWYNDAHMKIAQIPTTTRKQIYSALRLQQNTLEEITLCFDYCNVYDGAGNREPISFNEFHSLKRLRTQLPFLLPGEYTVKFGRPESQYKFYESLPPSLEMLQLQFGRFDFNYDNSETKTFDRPLKYFEQLVKQLGDAKAHLPALKSVGLANYGLSMTELWARGGRVEQFSTRTGIKIYKYDPHERESFKRN